MKFQIGVMPKWRGKPKVSPLDSDVEFQKLCSVITNNTLKPMQYAGVFVNESNDAKRLGTKNPARLVRDHLRRFLKELKLEADYQIIARQTAEPGVWAVGVILEPRESAQTAAAASRPRKH